jgi:protein phosphatase PTC1
MVVRFNNQALKARKTDASIGVEGDEDTAKGGISEADAIVEEARRHVEGKSETIAEEDSEEEKDEPENVEGLKTDIALNPDAPKSAIKNQS